MVKSNAAVRRVLISSIKFYWFYLFLRRRWLPCVLFLLASFVRLEDVHDSLSPASGSTRPVINGFPSTGDLSFQLWRHHCHVTLLPSSALIHLTPILETPVVLIIEFQEVHWLNLLLIPVDSSSENQNIDTVWRHATLSHYLITIWWCLEFCCWITILLADLFK